MLHTWLGFAGRLIPRIVAAFLTPRPMHRHVAQFTFGVSLFMLSIDASIFGLWPLTLLSLFFGAILFGVSFRQD